MIICSIVKSRSSWLPDPLKGSLVGVAIFLVILFCLLSKSATLGLSKGQLIQFFYVKERKFVADFTVYPSGGLIAYLLNVILRHAVRDSLYKWQHSDYFVEVCTECIFENLLTKICSPNLYTSFDTFMSKMVYYSMFHCFRS